MIMDPGPRSPGQVRAGGWFDCPFPIRPCARYPPEPLFLIMTLRLMALPRSPRGAKRHRAHRALMPVVWRRGPLSSWRCSLFPTRQLNSSPSSHTFCPVPLVWPALALLTELKASFFLSSQPPAPS